MTDPRPTHRTRGRRRAPAREELVERHRLSLSARVDAILADPTATEAVLDKALERAW